MKILHIIFSRSRKLSKMAQGVVVTGIIIAIVFIIVAVIFTIIFFNNRSKSLANPWWVWTLMIGGYVLFVVGLIMIFSGARKPKTVEVPLGAGMSYPVPGQPVAAAYMPMPVMGM